jgi:hypothetical protein
MAMSNTAKKTLITVVVTILVTILIYSIVGFVVNLSFMAIYDEKRMPDRFFYEPNSPDYSLMIQINNKAPLTLPLINPFYTVTVNVTGDNNTYACFQGSGGQPLNFTNWSLDAGIIGSGGSKAVTIIVHLGGGNFSVRVDVFLNFVIYAKATSATYLFENEGNNYYNITRS